MAEPSHRAWPAACVRKSRHNPRRALNCAQGKPGWRSAVHAQRDVVRFLAAYRQTWHRFFPTLNRRGQWHLVSHLCGRGRDGASVGELSGLVKQVFLLDDATVRERLGELYRSGFCTIDPPDRPVSARTVIAPSPLLSAKFDAHLIEVARNLLLPTRGVPAPQIDGATRRNLLQALACCHEAWLTAMERIFEANGLSTARRLEARRHLLSPSHEMLILIALQRWYGMTADVDDDGGEGVLADDMAAELLRLLRQNFQTTRDHVSYLMGVGLLERCAGRALHVALPEPVALELDRAFAQAAQELSRIAATFPGGDTAAEATVVLRAEPGSGAPAGAPGPSHVLVVTRAGEPERRVPLGPGPLLIGRSPASDLPLAATEVSRRHCQIAVVDGGVLATDLGSTNGTFVDGVRISAPTPFVPGTRMQIGPYHVVCRPVADTAGDALRQTTTATKRPGAALPAGAR